MPAHLARAFARTHSRAYTHVRAPSLRLRRTVEGEYPHPSDSDYKFGDITKAAVSKFTGKDEYEFGDISKKLFGDMKKMFRQK